MKYWLDRSSQRDNVVVVMANSIVVASCDAEHYDSAEAQLKNKETPSSIFGADNIEAIRFNQIQSVVSRSTDTDIEVSYKSGKDIDTETIYFADLAAKYECEKVFGIVLPEGFEKSEYQQSIASAVFSPLLSLLVAFVASYFYFDKWRWVAIIVGGAWILISLYSLVRRMRTPPKIVRWNLKGRYIRKAWHSLKTGFSYLVAGIIVVGFSYTLPDAYGEKSLYLKLYDDALAPEDVPKYLGRGAHIDFQDEDGTTPLLLAVQWEQLELAQALIRHGANVSIEDDYGETPLSAAIRSGNSILAAIVLDASEGKQTTPRLLIDAIEYGMNLEVIKQLKSRGSDLHSRDGEGRNLLARCIYAECDTDVVAYLLAEGVSPNFELDGQSPVDFARAIGRNDIAALLTDHAQRSGESAADSAAVEIQ
ncbi:MAG: ankyrin repeat domain-containing protein [Cellvibrionaceae bacterium]